MNHPESHDAEAVTRALSYVTDCVREHSDWGKVRIESNASWLMLDVWVKSDPTLPITMTQPHRFGIWLYTGVAYECDELGAASEDPCDLMTWMPPPT